MRDRILREVPEKRERCVKHFQMTQKGMAAAVYPAPVHYEEDGQWKEIDNRLEPVQEDGREVYRNFASAVRVSFAKESDTKELVTIEKDGKKILWGLSPFLRTKCTRNVNFKTNFYISCFGKGRFLERSRNVGYESVCFRRGRVRRG